MGYVRSLDWLERWDYMDAASQNKASVRCRKKWFGLSFTRSLGSQYTKEGLLRAQSEDYMRRNPTEAWIKRVSLEKPWQYMYKMQYQYRKIDLRGANSTHTQRADRIYLDKVKPILRQAGVHTQSGSSLYLENKLSVTLSRAHYHSQQIGLLRRGKADTQTSSRKALNEKSGYLESP